MAFTTSDVDSRVISLLRSRLGRVAYRNDRGAALVFAPAKLADVLGIVTRAVREAA